MVTVYIRVYGEVVYSCIWRDCIFVYIARVFIRVYSESYIRVYGEGIYSCIWRDCILLYIVSVYISVYGERVYPCIW